MRRFTTVMLAAGMLAAAVFTPVALAQGKKGGKKTIEFSDEAVAAAIKKGVEFLKNARKEDGSFDPYGKAGGGHYYPIGPTSIAAYAMLESGLVRYDDADIKKTLDFLEKWQAPDKLINFDGKATNQVKQGFSKYSHMTYELGLRANTWLAAVKQGGARYRKNLRADAAQLIKSTKNGSYGYQSYGLRQSSGDNSNSQYGVLGVWAAAQADEEVPRQYWYIILKHWMESVSSDGGWGYHAGRGTTPTMTTAGLATLFVCYDNLLADGFIKCDQGERAEAVLRPLTRALEWVDRYYQRARFSTTSGHGGRTYYLLYGIERVGLASGYKYFGKADWYRLGATWLINHQNDNGSWPGGYGPVVSTSYALLFLVRGRHAVLFNKLEFPGDWNNRPRDLAQLCRWTSKEFETTVNWQIVNLQVPPEEWLDAPILYLSGSTAPQFTPSDIDALRRYVHMGGTILSATECEGAGFSSGIREVYAKLFPDYEMVDAPADHMLNKINFKQLDGFPSFQIISNGIRPLVIHTDKDLPRSWQLRLTQTDKKAFQAPANVAMFVTGQRLAEKALAARGATTWPTVPKEFKPARAVKVARLKYNTTEGKPGNYAAEPLAWERLANLMALREQTQVDVTEPVDIAALPADANVAVLSGTDAIALGDAEVAALKDFTARGGVLLLEAAGGSRTFAEAAEVAAKQVANALPDELIPRKRIRPLAITSPIFQQDGAKIDEVSYRRYSRIKMGMTEKTPRLQGLLDNEGKARVLVSDVDLSAGLVGYNCYGVHGYQPDSAYELVRNILLDQARTLAKPKKDADKGEKKDGDGK